MRFYEHLLVFLVVFSLTTCHDLPSSFKKCKRDEEVSKCLKIAVQDALPKLEKGISALGFPSIKPLRIPALTIGEGARTVHVVQNFKNADLYGISEAIIEDMEATLTPTSAVFDLNAIMELKLNADYVLNGRILILPIAGSGKCTVLLKKLKTHLVLSGETIEKKDKTYMEIKDVKLTLKPEKVEFYFEDLFNGDKRLGVEMNKVMNENWEDVFEDIRSGYEEAIALIIKGIANRLFGKISYSDLFPL